jgi:very-short-patch-repair endonuclease
MKNSIKKYTCIGCGINVEKSCAKTIKFCSKDCYQKNKGSLFLLPKKGKHLKCNNCQKDIYKTQAQIKEKNYCSHICHNLDQSNKIKIKCLVCGKIKHLSPSLKTQKYCSIICRNKSSDFKKNLIKMNLIQQTGKENKLEKFGYGLLEENNIKFEKQKLMFDKFCVDAYLSEFNIVVQFDGDYWHGNKEKFEKLDKRQLKRIRLDNSQDLYMNKRGIKVIRVWESELRNNEKILIEKIKTHLLTS